jgi:Protein of unknown function (DUF2867)
MQIDPREHLARPLLIHALASDFELLDVWRLPVESERAEANFELFLSCFPLLRPEYNTVAADRPTRFLFAVRDVLLRVLRIESEDDIAANLPIPGCRETSLRERMTQPDRERFEIAATSKAPSPVYGTPNERVYELSNGTVHAALVLYWHAEADSHRAYMAIYSKSRGWVGRAYMALISPFRYWIVYPALLKATGRAWQQACSRIPSPAAP